MSKAYKIVARKLTMGDQKGETVYTVRPVSYGTLSTEDVARQISAESTATPGDVKAVLDRYAYYVKENLKKGYSIELLGFGNLYLRFITGKAVNEKKKADASLVKSLMPGFRPSFTITGNGNRLYDLIPEKISLVKYGEEETTDNGTAPTPSDGGTTTGGGTTTAS
ncbi:MAG: HU family DNA-binding protein [Prevotella sp.]|jgi:predicted histone-like DNA-binding protein|nr:HU family DNA-binding protein [Prevotella sp.]MCI1247218.1 HU family DNA-binding protein [Prevotella sp.]